jgi:acetyl esterase/lipase
MDVLSRTPLVANHRLPYGDDPLQFGDLWLPVKQYHPAAKKDLPVPLVVFFHGGWWRAEYDLAYTSFLADALRQAGMAVWTPEYRRVGNAGGGWPGTFQDAAASFDSVRKLAEVYPLDLERVVVAGHSAGGHLAFWIAGRHHIPESSPLFLPRPTVAVHAAVSLAGAVDLRLTCDLAGYFTFAHDKHEVYDLMGGSPAEVPDRYAAGDPGLLLPFNLPQTLLQGTDDGQIPPDLPARWAQNARRQHGVVDVEMVRGADHFDLVDPTSAAWPGVLAAFRKACFG